MALTALCAGWIFLLISGTSCKTKSQPQPHTPTDTVPDTTDNPVDTVEMREFIRGADLSFLPVIRQAGAVFYDSAGTAKDALLIFRENGCNTVRLRLWHTPAENHSDLPEVRAFAQEIKSLGMKVLLDFHYSDTWTDPGKQAKPEAWKMLSDSLLSDSVYEYTRRVVALIRPEYVQIGNEINGGMLWENGRINKPDAFTRFLKSGIRAVRETLPSTRIILHFAGLNGSDWFYNLLKTKQVDYDVIGLSYYPLFHGKDTSLLKSTMAQLASKYNRKIMLTEFSYPFTLQWADYTNNLVGLESQLVPGFPATPEGQKKYVFRLRDMIRENANGLGFCYWAPEWIAYRGPTSSQGSSAENQALFDFTHKALPAMKVYKP